MSDQEEFSEPEIEENQDEIKIIADVKEPVKLLTGSNGTIKKKGGRPKKVVDESVEAPKTSPKTKVSKPRAPPKYVVSLTELVNKQNEQINRLVETIDKLKVRKPKKPVDPVEKMIQEEPKKIEKKMTKEETIRAMMFGKR